MIVLDASAAVLGLLNDGDARRALIDEDVAIPHLADSEIAHALRAQELRGDLDKAVAATALSRWGRLGLRRFGASARLDRVWELRHNLSAYASYVALAETLACTLVTADARLARSPGPKCPITVLRR